MQKSNMSERLVRIQESPLFPWVMYNSIGGIIGVISGVIFQSIFQFILIFSDYQFMYDYHIPAIGGGLFLCMPIGLGIGVAQWLNLKHWQVPANGWIFATALGWSTFGLTTAFVGDYLDRLRDISSGQLLTIFAFMLLLGGMVIGLFQSIALKNSLLRPGPWILSNTFYLFAFLCLTIVVGMFPFTIKSYFLEFFYARDLYILVEMRYFFLLIYLVITLPFIAIVVYWLPTGKVLLKSIKTG